MTKNWFSLIFVVYSEDGFTTSIDIFYIIIYNQTPLLGNLFVPIKGINFKILLN